ncbi:MAG: alkaline phosphatase family protein [Candidatus Sericytochromatia bacterium]
MQKNSVPSIASLTATLCRLMAVTCPEEQLAPALAEVLQAQQTVLAGRSVQKCLVFAPDALGKHLYRYDPGLFAPIRAHCPLSAEVEAEMPSVTPVCFGSIFTGLAPQAHGIVTYAKPVLSCDTLFDFLARAGKRVAIVAVADSSIDKIFRNRPIDYFSEPYDQDVTDRTLALLAADSHDFILVYQQEYDDTLHEQTPFSDQAIQAVRNHGRDFEILARAAGEAWKADDHLLVVTPDHGAHIDPENGLGDHGLAIPEDLEVIHYYGLYPA